MDYSLPNEQVEIRRNVEVYKSFPGKIVEQMPLLLGEGRAPLWTARFMRRRIDHSEALSDLKDYLFVSDFVSYDLDRRSDGFKVILTVDKNGRVTEKGRRALGELNLSAVLKNGALEGFYFDGIELKREELVVGRDLSEEEVLNSKLWRILARHPDEVPAEFAEDKNLLKEYVQWVKAQTKQENVMGVYLDKNLQNSKVRALTVLRLGSGSGVWYGDDLVIGNGRLVGFLAPEARELSVADSGVDVAGHGGVRAYTEADVADAKRQLDALSAIVRGEALDKVKGLVDKL